LATLPSLATARFPHKKIFDDPLAFAGWKRRTANLALYLRVIGGLRTGLSLDDVIKRIAIRAREMDCHVSPNPGSILLYFPGAEMKASPKVGTVVMSSSRTGCNHVG
jgi:hypothetical protein